MAPAKMLEFVIEMLRQGAAFTAIT